MSSKIEIERKFLVTNSEFIKEAKTCYHIVQGYLASSKTSTVRIRLKDGTGILTIKGKSKDGGLSRYEWEKKIKAEDAKQLLELCGENYIDKHRYEILNGKHVYEIDVFHGENEGLVIAEIELNSIDESFEKPAWIGREVTGIRRFYNSGLTVYPYKNWTEEEKL